MIRLGRRPASISREARPLPAHAPEVNPERPPRLQAALPANAEALEAALPDLDDLPVEVRRGQVELPALEHPPPHADAALLDQPPTLAAAEPEVVREQRRHVNRPVAAQSDLLDVLGRAVLDVDLVEALLRRLADVGP